jgi:hypothetical protein
LEPWTDQLTPNECECNKTPLFGEGLITKSECDWLLCKLPSGRQNAPRLVFRQSARSAQADTDPRWKALEDADFRERPCWYEFPYLTLWSTKCGWVIGYYSSDSRFLAFTVRRPDGGMPTYAEYPQPRFTLTKTSKELTVTVQNRPYADRKIKYEVSDGAIWQVDRPADPTHGKAANDECTIS